MNRLAALAALVVLLSITSVAEAKKPKKAKEAEGEPVEEVAPAMPGGVELPCDYVPGEVHTYRFEKTQDRTMQGQPQTIAMTYDVGMKVLAAEGDEIRFELLYGPTT